MARGGVPDAAVPGRHRHVHRRSQPPSRHRFAVAYAPFAARYGDDHPFGEWSQRHRVEDFASSAWSWLLIPLGCALLIAAFHLMNAVARACARWTTAWLETGI